MSKINTPRGPEMASQTDTPHASHAPRAERPHPVSHVMAHEQDHSLETLIREHYPYIHRLALTILDDGSVETSEVETEAEDAAQDTFHAASRALSTFRGEATLKTWLTTIAVNQCRGRLRKRKTRQRLQNLLTQLQSLISNPPSPEEDAIQQDTHRRLWAAVDALDEKHRLPVLMRYVHELPVPEIAAALGLPEGTIHSRLNHARARLKEALALNGD